MTSPAYPGDSRLDLVTCPYNKSHQIQKNRFQRHLLKCGKSYPNIKKEICPFNVTHLVNAPELEYHIQTCSDRASFETFKYQDELVSDGSASQVITYQLDSEENWDNVNIEKSYDPKKYLDKANLLRQAPGGAKPSERKEFRKAEFHRLTGNALRK